MVKKLNIKMTMQNLKFFKTFWTLICNFDFCILIFAFLFVREGYCDTLRLKEIPEGKEGNEVEVLEEKEDSFIIKVPKEEIEVIKRKRPIEVKLWKEKRILWEDTGDYITLYLPKEKIVLPEDYKGDEFDSSKVLKEELRYSGAEGRPEIATFLRGTSRITGRVLKGGVPLAGVKLKIVNVSPRDTLSRIFGPDEKRSEEFVLEAVTDELGQYEFNSVPLGEYDIYWSLPGAESWFRRLSEKPDITVRPAETVKYPDIEIK